MNASFSQDGRRTPICFRCLFCQVLQQFSITLFNTSPLSSRVTFPVLLVTYCNKTNRCRPWLRFPVHSNQRPAPCSSKQSRLVECCECVTGDGISVESMLSCSAHIHQCHRYNIKLGNVQSTRWHNSFRTLTRLNDHFSTATCWASCRELSSLSLFLVIECCAAPCLFHSFILWLLLSIRPWGTKCIT